MSESNRNVILDLIKAYQAGLIYTLAPKHYVLRGFEYYRRGRVLRFEWKDDYSVLTAFVRGTRIYSVQFSASKNSLRCACSCPAWTPSSNCKHVICSIMTIKNLLHPDTFRIPGYDDSNRTFLLQSLLQAPVVFIPAEEKNTPQFSIVLKKDKQISDIYLQEAGKRSNITGRSIPHELRYLLLPNYFTVYGKLRDFIQYLKKYGNKYPIIFRTDGTDTEVTFDGRSECSCMTELDIYRNHLKISKVCLYNNKVFYGSSFTDEFVFDVNAKCFSLMNNRNDWRIWNDLSQSLFADVTLDEIPDLDGTSFTVPSGNLQKHVISFPSSEGVIPRNLILKVEGAETQPHTLKTRYRLRIIPSRDGCFVLQLERVIDATVFPPSQNTFMFFGLVNTGPSPQLRANKRKMVLINAFFKMLSARTKTEAGGILKQALAGGDFRKYKINHAARSFLKDHHMLFLRDENELIFSDSKCISVAVDKKTELLLYKIPYELFGWTIFNDAPSYDTMVVPSQHLYENLPLLYERLKEKNIALFFEHKPLQTAAWDFTFHVSKSTSIDWFEIRPEIRCNGELIDESLFMEVFKRRGVVEKEDCIQIMDFNSQKIFDMISNICRTDVLSKDRKKEIVQVPRLQIFDWIMLRNNGIKVRLPQEDEEIIGRLISFEKIESKPLPDKLNAKLRQYQKDGYSWLAFLYEHRFGACLADDMGLGKTIQAISLLGGIKEGKIISRMKEKRLPHLIVLPPSLLFNWENEIKRFYPDLKIIFYTGKERSISFDGYDAVLTTYAIARRDAEKLRGIQFDVIIFDEAQAIKNIFADTTGAVRQLKAIFKLAMTGTPLENHLGEYYSIVDLTLPGLLGNFEKFKPLIKQDFDSPLLDTIIKRTHPFVLRRTKEKILKELPPKIETDIYLELTEKQKVLYKKTVEQIRSAIDNAYRTKTQAQAKIIALTALLKLRQLCISPQLLDPHTKDSSPKIDFLVENLKELLKEKHSALVFSQFTSFLNILEVDLKKHGIDFLRLDGSTQVTKRKKLIETYQTGNGPPIFLLSLKAGGQGLNLTRASYVYHLDPWWNPAVENQASDRAHRIGQKNNVTITRILMKHTIEEKMMFLKKKKLELYKAVMEDTLSSKRGLSISQSDFDFLLS